MLDRAKMERLSAPLIEALREAQAMVATGQVGAEFEDVLRHARELLDLMCEQFAAPVDARAAVLASGFFTKLGVPQWFELNISNKISYLALMAR